MLDIKFEVGSKHTNMKGEYEVISIQRDEMVIRWTDGSEATTTIDLQKRILDRIAHEKEKARIEQEKLNKKKKKK